MNRLFVFPLEFCFFTVSKNSRFDWVLGYGTHFVNLKNLNYERTENR